jgi:uncharacterized SAM-binding protein YcdF (DUF218 family)
MRITRRRVVVAVLVVVALVAAGLAFAVHLVLAPTVGSVPDRADAIVVFAGERARVDLALELAAEGRADTVVLSNGAASRETSALCGQTAPVTVICQRPEPLDTRGEARMFAEIARDHGWHDLIAVTGNYHVSRARLLLERCWTGGTSFAAVPWPHIGLSPLLHEVGGLAQAATVARAC